MKNSNLFNRSFFSMLSIFVLPFMVQITHAQDANPSVTPLNVQVETLADHVSITVNDELDFAEYGLTNSNRFDYAIHLYIHPLNGQGWWSQAPATVNKFWTAQAYLGGTGAHSPKHGDKFEVAAILSHSNPPGKVINIGDLVRLDNFYLLGDIRTFTVLRNGGQSSGD